MRSTTTQPTVRLARHEPHEARQVAPARQVRRRRLSVRALAVVAAMVLPAAVAAAAAAAVSHPGQAAVLASLQVQVVELVVAPERAAPQGSPAGRPSASG